MTIEIQRKWLSDESTIGTLSVNGVFLCYTLEDKVREVPGKPVSEWKIKGQTAIPRGTYKLVIDYSTRFKRDMFHILDVPGFDGIRIHSGNTDKDTEGCILLGTTHSQDEIENSRVALAMLWAKLATPRTSPLPANTWELREPCEVTIS